MAAFISSFRSPHHIFQTSCPSHSIITVFSPAYMNHTTGKTNRILNKTAYVKAASETYNRINYFQQTFIHY